MRLFELPRTIRQHFGLSASSILCQETLSARKEVATGWEEAFTQLSDDSFPPDGGFLRVHSAPQEYDR